MTIGYSAELSRELALVCDAEGTISWVDQRAVLQLGAQAGASLLSFMVGDSAAKCQQFLGQASHGRALGWELTMLASGEPVTYECSGMPIEHGVLIVATRLPVEYERTIVEMGDTVTEMARLRRESVQQQRRVEELSVRLAYERETIEAVLQQLPSGVMVIDARTGHVTLANTRLEEIFGSSVTTLQGSSAITRMFYPDGDRYEPDSYPIQRSLTAGEVVRAEQVDIRRSDGTVRVVQVSSTPVLHDDVIVAAVATYHDITELKRMQEQFEHESLHDPLTGLPNRRMFMLRLTHALVKDRRRETGSALLFIDVDGFKGINDTLGHFAGDEVLLEVARRLKKIIRGDDTVARLAGDEFTILLESMSDDSLIERIAARVLEACSTPIDIEGTMVRVGASVGIAIGQSGEPDAETLLRQADAAMYEAKQAGKGELRFYRPNAPRDTSLSKTG